MREIKFRAWDKELKIMIYGKEQAGYIEYDTNPLNVINIMFNEDDYGLEYMQYTSLKDKNSKEIYEGDIVLLDILDAQNSNLLNDEEKKKIYKRDLQIISFEKGSFGFYPVFPELNNEEDKNWRLILDADGDLWSRHMKVIDNIYENPDLLESN